MKQAWALLFLFLFAVETNAKVITRCGPSVGVAYSLKTPYSLGPSGAPWYADQINPGKITFSKIGDEPQITMVDAMHTVKDLSEDMEAKLVLVRDVEGEDLAI